MLSRITRSLSPPRDRNCARRRARIRAPRWFHPGYETTALPPSHWLRLQFLLCRRPFSLRRDPPRRRQRGLRPGDELIGFVKQPLRHAPKREVDGAALLRVIERRKGLSFPERHAVLVINPEIKRVLGHHPKHHAVAEHTGFAEHAAHRDAAERGKLLAQELGKGSAGNHLQSP